MKIITVIESQVKVIIGVNFIIIFTRVNDLTAGKIHRLIKLYENMAFQEPNLA